MSYEMAKAKQARLYKRGVFVSVIANGDGTYRLEQPFKKRTLRLV